MSKTLTAGLAWALPVKPDDLLVTIDAYTTALPTIRALRKCNRYGQGPQAYVTKLPAEIVSAIESILFDKQLRQYNPQHMTWEVEFSCFESTCAPSDHFKGSGLDLGSAADEYMMDFEECDSCSKNSYGPQDKYDGKCENRCRAHTPANQRCRECKGVIDTKSCERICPNAYEEAMNEAAQDMGNGTHDEHMEGQNNWPSRISGGTFAKYAKVRPYLSGNGHRLLTSAGVEGGVRTGSSAFTTVKAANGTWPHHKNHRWQMSDGRQTTLCYLTLPRRSGPHSDYNAIDSDEDRYDVWSDPGQMDTPDIPAAQALEVDTASLTITDKQRRRFQRVLKKLGLQLYVHGSQVRGTKVSPNTDVKVSTMATEKDASSTKKGMKLMAFSQR
ncbi:hypothetical protein LTR17_001535 [Elasticomyces elasticus]|nr:hypothetical protein LTR17_001535 [Elasticomyces elasticus]